MIVVCWHAVGFLVQQMCCYRVACIVSCVFLVGARAVGVGVVCENCIVDASIFILEIVFCVCALVLCVFFIKGVRWMPWHAEPMKDV